MERQTMGSFLAALRKASGLTQKSLAEKLNVSDKSVSRWERDEGAPDLSLIPVIAEIFGITSDELLRGQRKTETEPTAAAQTRTEKQRARLFAASLSGFRSKSLLAMGLALCGLIAALVGNFAFLRAYIGFFAGAVLFLTAVIVQSVCINSAFLAVSDEELPHKEAGHFRRKVVFLGETSIGLTLSLFVATLPLILWTGDAYRGLSGESFFQSGLLLGGAAAVICIVTAYCLNGHLLKGTGFAVDEETQAIYCRNHRLKKICSLALFALLLITVFANGAATGFGDVGRVAKGTIFHDYKSFKAFMEQDVPAEDNRFDMTGSAVAPVLDGSVTYTIPTAMSSRRTKP